MIAPATLLAFTMLNIGFALIPGPDVICILTHAVTRGTRAGAAVCAGIACAALVHVAAASLGLTAFLAAVPTAFVAVKAAGAVYLVWLADAAPPGSARRHHERHPQPLALALRTGRSEQPVQSQDRDLLSGHPAPVR